MRISIWYFGTLILWYFGTLYLVRGGWYSVLLMTRSRMAFSRDHPIGTLGERRQRLIHGAGRSHDLQFGSGLKGWARMVPCTFTTLSFVGELKGGIGYQVSGIVPLSFQVSPDSKRGGVDWWEVSEAEGTIKYQLVSDYRCLDGYW